MSSPRLHIEIDAVWHEGRWRMVGEDGRQFATVPSWIIDAASRAASVEDQAWLNEWHGAARKVVERAAGRAYHQSGWDKKCACIVTGLTKRRLKAEKPKRKVRESYDWSYRAQYIYQTCYSNHRRNDAERDEWTRWARSICRNQRRRETDRKANRDEG